MTSFATKALAPGGGSQAVELLRTTLRHHAWMLAIIVSYIGLVVAILISIDRPYRIADRFYLLTALVPPVLAAFCVLLGQVIFHVMHVRPFSPVGLLRDIRQDDRLRLWRLGYAAIPILSVIAFQSAFTSFKSSITFINPFQYDALFMEIDRWLHFGRQPWEWLQPLLGYPIVTSAISFAYKLWYGVFYLIFFWMAFSTRSPQLRMRYLISYLLCWALLGSLAATFLSSAGPCFYGLVVPGDDPYAPLFGYLKEADAQHQNWSLFAQAYLWENYALGQLNSASGISAMPSLHVAIAALQALLGWQLSRRAGLLLTAYCVVIMIGSVHLGWHYAIDGYVSVLAVIVIWKAVGWTLHFHPSFAWTKDGQEEPEASEAALAR